MIYNNGVQYLNNNNNCGLTQDQQKLKLCANLIYQILSNQKFIGSISNTVKMARSYYNDRKEFCRAFHINMNYQQCQNKSGNKNVSLNVYLPGGNSNCFYQNMGPNHLNLMYVIPQQGLKTSKNYSIPTLPSQWAPPRGLAWTKVTNAQYQPFVYPVSIQNPYDPPGNELGMPLTGDALVIYYYFKNVHFFTSLLSMLKQSIIDYSNFKFMCKKIVFPEDIYCGSLSERTFVVSGEFLHQVYNHFLRGFNNHKKLPIPTSVN